MNLKQSKRELAKAERSLEAMLNSRNVDVFESSRTDFLMHLEKARIKAERECQIFKNKFQPRQGKFIKLRKEDELLKYLKNARDADTHTVQEIVEKKPGSTSISFSGNKNSGHIKHMRIINGKLIKYEGDPIDITFTPGKLKARSFTVNGKSYEPPQRHIGEKLTEVGNPVEIAKLGIGFYKEYLGSIEAKFFS